MGCIDDASAEDFVVPIKHQRLPWCGRTLVFFEFNKECSITSG
ncbi:uncharacterized protein METZ01_LOCUS427293, partial [marine metagenome]